MPKPNKARQEAKQAAQNQRFEAFDAAKITTGTISAAKIGTLDAGWLAIGTIPASKINLSPTYVANLKRQYPGLEKKEEIE